jgi:hypothetical protein
MTRSPSNHRNPGTLLLKLASIVFDKAVLTSIVVPTIADLQAEVDAAGDNRMRRQRARLRGYGAFWTLVLFAPFAAHVWPVRQEDIMMLQQPRRSGLSGWVVLAGILGFTSPALTPWTATVVVGGLVFAVAIHLWYSRHPSLVATPNGEGRPEINYSRTPVGGNVGGLIFMAGSMAILVAGLPGWRWFFGAAVVGGLLTAALVFMWHAARPSRGLPENLIVLR